MLKASTIQLLRFHFSFFLMPVYWLAVSQTQAVDTKRAIIIFIILHLIVYPASNGYNSYMDRDEGSIGGIKNPKQPTRQLYYASILLDMIALASSLLISKWFFAGILLYIAASRAYSYRGIRLKKYPIIGYLTVICFQGALTFFLVMHGSSVDRTLAVPPVGMIAASLLIGGFYPLTQIYQHMQDKEDGVTTISYKLGYTGTFIFTAIIYFLAMMSLAIYLNAENGLGKFFIIQIFLSPVIAYFLWWFYKVFKNVAEANYVNTMRMNVLAAVFTNAAFIYLFIIEKI